MPGDTPWRSTVLVPAHLWSQIKSVVGVQSEIAKAVERADQDNQVHHSKDPLRKDLIRDLAKADGNQSWVMAEHTLTIMYGEMADILLSRYTIARKEDDNA